MNVSLPLSEDYQAWAVLIFWRFQHQFKQLSKWTCSQRSYSCLNSPWFFSSKHYAKARFQVFCKCKQHLHYIRMKIDSWNHLNLQFYWRQYLIITQLYERLRDLLKILLNWQLVKHVKYTSATCVIWRQEEFKESLVNISWNCFLDSGDIDEVFDYALFHHISELH